MQKRALFSGSALPYLLVLPQMAVLLVFFFWPAGQAVFQSMTISELLAESAFWRSYDLPAELAGRMWGGAYRGQTQKWFALRFTGAEPDIRLDTPHAEFDAWRWVAPDALVDLIVPFKRDVYVDVVEEFRPLWTGPGA